jgi:hypothetical protein
MQPFGARSGVVVLELIEGRIVRTKGVAEEAMLGLGGRRRRVSPEVVRAFVVGDQNWTARNIRVVRMRPREAARAEAEQQQKRNAGTPDP